MLFRTAAAQKTRSLSKLSKSIAKNTRMSGSGQSINQSEVRTGLNWKEPGLQ